MKEIETFSKNKNFSFNDQDQNQNQDGEYNISNEYNSDYEQEILDNEYYEKTLNIIYKEFAYYIESKSLPICEYLEIKNIEKFLKKILNNE